MNLDLKHKVKPKNEKDLIRILLKNRNLKTKSEIKNFFSPKNPLDINLNKVGLSASVVKKCIGRVKKALKNKEKVIIYGDYDADGITATAILWEVLYKLGLDVLPYIPERFSEGYGLNVESIKELKIKNPTLSLIISVDNGIVAFEAVEEAQKLGIDVIVTDHHQKTPKKLKTDFIVHTTEIGGAGISWFFAREIEKAINKKNTLSKKTLELAAIGTISDQIPLLGPNRSIVKYGLSIMKSTKRTGLLSLFKSAGIEKENIGIFDINFVVAPRINAMGRLKHGLDSLRILCTTNTKRGVDLSKKLGKVNTERQKVVKDVFAHARTRVVKTDSVIVVSHKSYNEGVVGLVASRLVDEYWKPAIVFFEDGEMSKASARSIPGFNIIKAIRRHGNLIERGGGHPMAAGFSMKTKNLGKFQKAINKYAKEKLTEEILIRSIRVDVETGFNLINNNLWKYLERFEPAGVGNPRPVFLTKEVDVIESRLVGKDRSHLKLKLGQAPLVIDAIGFGIGKEFKDLKKNDKVNVVYTIDENVWNGRKNLQLKVKNIFI